MACLMRRGIVEEEDCPICQGEPETILHALWDCRGVKSVWSRLGVRPSNTVFWDSNLQEWLNFNGRQNGSANLAKIPWRILFSFTFWLIWKNRNQVVFRRKTQNPKLAVEIVNQVTEYIHCFSSPRMPICKRVKRICWSDLLEDG